MRFFGRSATHSGPVPLVLPRLDGSGWPAMSGRPSFEASTYAEMGNRRAYEPDAHALADRLADAVLPRLRTGASAEDEPHLHKVFRTAARIGVGIGLVGREATSTGPGQLDPGLAGALGVAQRGLPSMQPGWARTAAWMLLGGHYLARQEPSAQDVALAALVEQVEPLPDGPGRAAP